MSCLMQRLFFGFTVAASLLAVSSAVQAIGRLADVDVIDRRTGRVLPVYAHDGEYWVAGQSGARYAIRVRNQTGARILTVMSVDGVNILSGETAALEQSGYVLSPWQQTDITGWRKSNSQVAAFEFTASHNSYAERTGRPADVGVIGVAVFRERAPVRHAPPVWREPQHDSHRGRRMNDAEYGSASPAPAPAPAAPAARAQGGMSAESSAQSSAKSSAHDRAESQASSRYDPPAQPSPKLGTGHGARESSYTSTTTFERLTQQPQDIIRIRYDSHERLVAMGVIREWPYRYEQRPNPFPESPAAGYVPDPPRR
jgi:hypothetical protein